MDMGSKDSISSLPDALVCHILSFLSTKYAALTSFHSKRWRYLLAFVPNLEFDSTIYDHHKMGRRKRLQMRQSFKVFVDRIMALQENALVNKFFLRCEVNSDPSSVNGWILNMLERGVVDLDLDISLEYGYPLPSKVWMNKTLVRLKVEGTYKFTTNMREVFLPKLKTLYLDDVAFEHNGAAFAKLITCCHVLEELVLINVIRDFWESCSVSIPTLKRLKICCDYNEKNPESVSSNTPNLVHLEFTDKVAVKYPKVNFDSLVEATFERHMFRSKRQKIQKMVIHQIMRKKV